MHKRHYIFIVLTFIVFIVGFSATAHAFTPEAQYTIDGRTWKTSNSSGYPSPSPRTVYSGDDIDFSFTSTVTGSGSNSITGLFWATIDFSTAGAVITQNASSGTTINTVGCLAGHDQGSAVPPPARYNCGAVGQTVYDTLSLGGSAPPSQIQRFTVHVNLNDSGADRTFCVRMHVGRYYPNGMDGMGSPSKSISEIIQWQKNNAGTSSEYVYDQAVYGVSNQYCYTIAPQISPEGDISNVTCDGITSRAYDRQPTRGALFGLYYLDPGGSVLFPDTSAYGSARNKRATAVTGGVGNGSAYDFYPANLRNVFGAGSTKTFVLVVVDNDTGEQFVRDYQDFYNNCYPPPSPPSASISGDCDNVWVWGLNDPNWYDVQYEILAWPNGDADANGDGIGDSAVALPHGNPRGSGNFVVANPYDNIPNTGWTYRMYMYDVDNNGGGQSTTNPLNRTSNTISTGACYIARCTIDINEFRFGDPADGELAGSTFTAWVTLYNDVGGAGRLRSSVGGEALSATQYPYGTAWAHNPPFPHNEDMNTGSWVLNAFPDIPIGGSVSQQFTFNAPPNIGQYYLNVYPDYFGPNGPKGPGGVGDAPGNDCPVSVRTFKEYQLDPEASISFDSQDPSIITYGSKVTDSKPIRESGINGIAATATRRLYKQGGGNVDGPSNYLGSGPGGRFYTTDNGDRTITNPFLSNGGDSYCASTYINYHHGWIGPGGVIVGNTDKTVTSSCPTVNNKPYFKVYGSGVSAGGDFEAVTPTCTGGGTLASWNNNSGVYPYGAGTVLHAIAFGNIVGFASARTSNARSATDLTFANKDLPPGSVSTSSYSPKMGGYFAGAAGIGSHCLPMLSPKPSATVLSGNQTIGGRTVPTGTNEEIFVNGDVYISGDIKYDLAGWNINSADGTTNVPSFKLVVNGGDIYIGPGVTDLSGIYIAQPKADGTKGQIYTCGTSAYTKMVKNTLFSTCRNQLLVRGSFVAKKVNLMRTFGSLRDEKPSIQPGPRFLYWSNTGSPIAGMTCSPPLRESSDPYWTGAYVGHYLCSSNPGIQLGWTYAWWDPRAPNGTPQQQTGLPYCTNVSPSWEIGESPSTDWGDNFVCSNVRLQFSDSGPIPGYNCVLMNEPLDPHGPEWSTQPYMCEMDNVAIAPSPAATCSNAGIRNPGYATCAAEIFDFSSELYLSKNPNVQPDDNGAIHYDAVTSLPPIL
jgi:hypothetical protein